MVALRYLYSMDVNELPILTNAETTVWQDRSFFEAKQTLAQKIATCLAALEGELRLYLSKGSTIFSEAAILPAGKISKGENLDGYPYLLLDYPRSVQKNRVLLYRTICWLGHGCTSSLIYQGNPLTINGWKLNNKNYLISYGADIWNNDPGASCYSSIQDIPENTDGIRIMRDFGMIEPRDLPELAVQEWIKLEAVLSTSGSTDALGKFLDL
ncbi:MAG TPA: hypothetical protein DHW15_04355 [Bacteroidetes bacterium]|jgi:hypothetical protein|nr:MAG: hypothetical protein ABR94_13460 [Sphingobacteriales bacterium BACL12 MAG-120802-bin5]KRP13326.1 MAG: hypothetical protein ABR95_09050 [Sphingobacteriales bacterium BACL12 MAG-120813-bin55]HCK21402.1 hypothetical protein [Bacteroidota bacterium]